MQQPGINELINRITEVIRQPELHMREVPILIGLVILLTFIIFILIAIVFVRPGKKEVKPLEEKELRRSIQRRYIAALVVSIPVLVSLGIMSNYSAKPGFCAACHEMRSAYNESSKSVHKGASCVSCHQAPGAAGLFIGKLELIEMAISKSKIVGGVSSSQVTNEACLKCHSETLKSVKMLGTIKVKHKEPVEAGYKCTDCHYSKRLFHTGKRKLDDFGMSRCVNCHNQNKASAECDVCHTSSIRASAGSNRDDYPMVNLPNTINCKSCHASSFCLKCHTVQLPHDEDWKVSEHALQGFVEKDLCRECHEESSCKKCHKEVSSHGDDWVEDHGPSAKMSPTWCSNCHRSEFCLICHSDAVNFKLNKELPKPSTSPMPLVQQKAVESSETVDN